MTETPSPRIGAFVLETLTTGMYINPLDTLREYVQNSFDSIRAAENLKLINKSYGKITIGIDPSKKIATIRDNGAGIPKAEAYSRLVNIGMSDKSIEADAGFRGIGRLAGIAYCKKLVFSTKVKGEAEMSQVTFDCEKLRKSMSPNMRQVKELSQVISSYAEYSQVKEKKEDHYFEVKLEEINKAGQVFLEWEKVYDYVSQVAPVGFDNQSFPYATEIRNWIRKHRISNPEVTIEIISQNTNIQAFKPYKKITYSTLDRRNKIHLKGIRFFPENPESDTPFWGWWADTNCPGTVGDEKVAGFRMRKSNFSIGLVEPMNQIFSESSVSYGRLNKYFIGEIYILSSKVIPNARRDGFEDNSEWTKIRKELIEFAKARSREAHRLSQARNQDIEKLSGQAEKQLEIASIKQKRGFSGEDEKNKVAQHLSRQIEKIQAAGKGDREKGELERISELEKKLENALAQIEENPRYAAQNLNSALDKKQRKIIKEILGLLYKELDATTYETVSAAIFRKYGLSSED